MDASGDMLSAMVSPPPPPPPCDGVTCPAATSDCKVAGTCQDLDGSCSAQTNAADGTACSDGDPGTDNDVCTAGVCAGVAPPPPPAPEPPPPPPPLPKDAAKQVVGSSGNILAASNAVKQKAVLFLKKKAEKAKRHACIKACPKEQGRGDQTDPPSPGKGGWIGGAWSGHYAMPAYSWWPCMTCTETCTQSCYWGSCWEQCSETCTRNSQCRWVYGGNVWQRKKMCKLGCHAAFYAAMNPPPPPPPPPPYMPHKSYMPYGHDRRLEDNDNEEYPFSEYPLSDGGSQEFEDQEYLRDFSRYLGPQFKHYDIGALADAMSSPQRPRLDDYIEQTKGQGRQAIEDYRTKDTSGVHFGRGTHQGRRGLLLSDAAKASTGADRAASMVAVLGHTTEAVATRLLPGEEPEIIESDHFSMEVQRFTSDGVEGAGTARGQVLIPAGQNLSNGQTVSTQTIVWAINPYENAGVQAAEDDPDSVINSEVVTVRMFGENDELEVAGLPETFNITLRTFPADESDVGPNSTANVTCSSLSCINTYDVAQGEGSCDHAIANLGYTCEAHFCSSCTLAGFCDLSCDPSCAINATFAGNESNATNATHRGTPACDLEPVSSCTYWDTSANVWRTDGTVIARTNSTVTCAFTHLTDFAALLAPPAQTAPLASIKDTFDLWQFLLDNPVGLIFSLVLFLCVIGTTTRSMIQMRRERATKVRHMIKTNVVRKGGVAKEYARRFEGDEVMTFGERVEKLLPTRLRSNYICGSLFRPLKGEPFDRWQRLLVVVCTFLLTLMVNVFFFQSKHNQKEICEGPLRDDGRVGNCTGGIATQSLCYCRVFDCGSIGCDCEIDCVGTADECASHCAEVKDSRILRVLITLVLTWPIGTLLKNLFDWLHKPYSQMVKRELILAEREDQLHGLQLAGKVRHGAGKRVYRRYGRDGRKKAERHSGESDLVGDSGAQLWTDTDEGQKAIEEEAMEQQKEDWEKEPILPDGRLPCEECGEKPMRPVSEIDKVDYEHLLKKVSQVGSSVALARCCV